MSEKKTSKNASLPTFNQVIENLSSEPTIHKENINITYGITVLKDLPY